MGFDSFFLKEGISVNKQNFTSVWDALEDTPAEAENMRLRAELMRALKAQIISMELNQAQAAQLFGVTQPRISDLMRGKINVFGLDALVNMAAAAGLHLHLSIQPAMKPAVYPAFS